MPDRILVDVKVHNPLSTVPKPVFAFPQIQIRTEPDKLTQVLVDHMQAILSEKSAYLALVYGEAEVSSLGPLEPTELDAFCRTWLQERGITAKDQTDYDQLQANLETVTAMRDDYGRRLGEARAKITLHATALAVADAGIVRLQGQVAALERLTAMDGKLLRADAKVIKRLKRALKKIRDGDNSYWRMRGVAADALNRLKHGAAVEPKESEDANEKDR